MLKPFVALRYMSNWHVVLRYQIFNFDERLGHDTSLFLRLWDFKASRKRRRAFISRKIPWLILFSCLLDLEQLFHCFDKDTGADELTAKMLMKTLSYMAILIVL